MQVRSLLSQVYFGAWSHFFFWKRLSHSKSLLVRNVVGFSQWVSINKKKIYNLAKRKKILNAYIFCHYFAKLNWKMLLQWGEYINITVTLETCRCTCSSVSVFFFSSTTITVFCLCCCVYVIAIAHSTSSPPFLSAMFQPTGCQFGAVLCSRGRSGSGWKKSQRCQLNKSTLLGALAADRVIVLEIGTWQRSNCALH